MTNPWDENEDIALKRRLRYLELENESLRMQLEIKALNQHLADTNISESPLNSTEFFKKLDEQATSTPKENVRNVIDWSMTPGFQCDESVLQNEGMKLQSHINSQTRIDTDRSNMLNSVSPEHTHQGTQTPTMQLKETGHRVEPLGTPEVMQNQGNKYMTKRIWFEDQNSPREFYTPRQEQTNMKFGDKPQAHRTDIDTLPGLLVQNQATKSSKHTVMMKPATFDGTISWIDYKAHFDV